MASVLQHFDYEKGIILEATPQTRSQQEYFHSWEKMGVYT